MSLANLASGQLILEETSPPKFESGMKQYSNDPIGVSVYTLSNGLTLIMSVNKNEPRIMTNIAVRAGSKFDPAETTGLAHYLEHMMFKGTSVIGALDWGAESKVLQEISDLYEQYRATTDTAERKRIYTLIDKASNRAANYVAANEYDKIVQNLGAKATNAYTWVEQTVYVNDIPANELERWMKLESDRFRTVVLRLFHTELEAVYEEYNINQDRDFRKVFKAMSEELFPTHPYGTQTTIGQSEHLKNPSHVNIHDYFNKYYIPNNIAIILSGDFDPELVAGLAEMYWGDYKPRNLDAWNPPAQPERKAISKREVLGQEAAYVQIGWRAGGADTNDPMMLSLISGLLYNQQAGLLDLNVIQKQLVLEASAWQWNYADYNAFGLQGKPREGQSVEEVEKILLGEIEKLKRGEFEDWLLEAVVKDFKLSRTRGFESNNGRVSRMTEAFILGKDWDYYIREYDQMGKITKQQVMDFCKKMLGDNYAVVYKRSGTDPNVVKVPKPAITPVKLNREARTQYAEKLFNMGVEDIEPQFVDYTSAIKSTTIGNGVKLDYIANSENQTFTLYYVWDMGKAADKKLPLALNYLTFLGTEKYTPEQLQQEFYKLGCSMDISSSEDVSYVYVTGLSESFDKAVALMEHVLGNVKADEEKWQNIVSDILSKRVNSKKSKETILRTAMVSFAKYGQKSPFTDILSESELKALSGKDLAAFLRSLTSHKHTIFYYGSHQLEAVKASLTAQHKTPATLKDVPTSALYPELDTREDKVIFVDFPMVQTEFILLSKGSPSFEMEEYTMANLYNNYFGSGLSSIVFQEIRESKALAYSASAFYGSPSKLDRAHWYQAYVGTQSDKLKDAMTAMRTIIEDMPVSEAQVNNAVTSVKKRIESERITRSSIWFSNRSNRDLGVQGDIRLPVYMSMDKVNSTDLVNWQKKHVKGRHYTILILGDKSKVDMNYINTLGPVQTLTLEQLFGY